MSNSVYGLSKEFLICDNLRSSRRAIGSNAQGLYGTPEKAQMASGMARPEQRSENPGFVESRDDLNFVEDNPMGHPSQ
jgi:hypothetical protein